MRRVADASRLLLLIVLAAGAVAVAAPQASAGEHVTTFSPADAATVSSKRPTFSVGTTGFDPNGSIFIHVSNMFQAPGGMLGIGTLVFGSLITANVPTPSSSTFAATEYVDLPDGTYYWQWEYFDSGCAVFVIGITFQRPDCQAPSDTQCNFNGDCYGPVHTFTINTVPDFIVAANATNLSVTPGETVPLDANLTWINNFNSSVTVSLAGLPQGATVTYSPAGDVMHMQIATAPTTPPGTYPLTISATGGGLSRNAAATLTVLRLPPPVAVSIPTVSGTFVAGQQLTAAPGGWTGTAVSYAYQWYRCDGSGANCATIGGASGQTYLLSVVDVGATLEVVVTATNPGGSTSSTSSSTTPIVAAPVTHKPAPTAKPKPKPKPKTKPKKKH